MYCAADRKEFDKSLVKNNFTMASDDLKWFSQEEMQQIVAENKRLDNSVKLMMKEVEVRISAQIKAENQLDAAKKELKLIKQVGADRINNLRMELKKLREENEDQDEYINGLQQEIMKYKELFQKIKSEVIKGIN